MPPSTSTSIRPSTASTTSGSASIVAGAPSSWRPPWLETITPAAPCSQASAASSAVTMPFTSTGRLESETSSSRSSHSTEGSIRENMSAGVPAVALPAAAAKLGTVTSAGITKPVRRSRSRRPSRGASTVSAIASKPASSAWSISARVTPRSRKQ